MGVPWTVIPAARRVHGKLEPCDGTHTVQCAQPRLLMGDRLGAGSEERRRSRDPIVWASNVRSRPHAQAPWWRHGGNRIGIAGVRPGVQIGWLAWQWHFGDPTVGSMRPRRELARSLLVEGDLNGGGHVQLPGVDGHRPGFSLSAAARCRGDGGVSRCATSGRDRPGRPGRVRGRAPLPMAPERCRGGHSAMHRTTEDRKPLSLGIRKVPLPGGFWVSHTAGSESLSHTQFRNDLDHL